MKEFVYNRDDSGNKLCDRCNCVIKEGERCHIRGLYFFCDACNDSFDAWLDCSIN